MGDSITPTMLSAALGVNAQVRCDCGALSFLVGLAYVAVTENNFIRILECQACGHQMPMVHASDAQLAPRMMGTGTIQAWSA